MPIIYITHRDIANAGLGFYIQMPKVFKSRRRVIIPYAKAIYIYKYKSQSNAKAIL